MKSAAIEFCNVTKRFEESVVLDGLTLRIDKGEAFFIVGPSGTGKSVTLKHIVGLLEPDEGTVSVASEHIGYLFQSGALLAWLTVWENVALPLQETTDLTDDEIADKVDKALSAVGLLESADKYPSEISGGMQKRAGLARSIVCDADVILYDEPTSGLDPVTSQTINRLIVRLKEEKGVTSVVVTHDLQSALAIADRIMLLKGGKAVFCGTPDEFIKSRNSEVQEFVSAMKGDGYEAKK